MCLKVKSRFYLLILSIFNEIYVICLRVSFVNCFLFYYCLYNSLIFVFICKVHIEFVRE